MEFLPHETEHVIFELILLPRAIHFISQQGHISQKVQSHNSGDPCKNTSICVYMVI